MQIPCDGYILHMSYTSQFLQRKLPTMSRRCPVTGEVVCEAPNNAVDKFHGALLWSGQSYSLDMGHLLLRGCTLRNTSWCFGLVVFAGRDSKLLMNDTAPPSFIKQGHLDKIIDQLVIWVCCVSLQQSELCIKNIHIALLLLGSSSLHRVLLIIIIIIKPLDRRWVVVPSILLDHWLCPMRHQRRVLCRFPVVASTDGEADHVDVSIAACCVVDAWNKQISAN